mmetsp:Transcript_77605/g.215005  ORF Transcript_77605/g.215005 Transcript_77605/m.215005 type:complete len:206 (-) Transcript_77605:142-759(-)
MPPPMNMSVGPYAIFLALLKYEPLTLSVSCPHIAMASVESCPAVKSGFNFLIACLSSWNATFSSAVRSRNCSSSSLPLRAASRGLSPPVACDAGRAWRFGSVSTAARRVLLVPSFDLSPKLSSGLVAGAMGSTSSATSFSPSPLLSFTECRATRPGTDAAEEVAGGAASTTAARVLRVSSPDFSLTLACACVVLACTVGSMRSRS